LGGAYDVAMLPDDSELLHRYVSEDSQEAFAEFVRRHLPLVFSAAERRLGGDVHQASDVSQIVFTSVARNARRLSRHPAITGWLHTATRHTAIDLVRKERRRTQREQQAQHMQEISDSSNPADLWSRLRPVIDAVLDDLSRRDRELILRRFFQHWTFVEIGHALNITDEAARKRIDRALETMRRQLGRRGLSSTNLALSAALGTETMTAAPPATLAATIVGCASLSTNATAGLAFMTITKLQAVIIAAVLVGGGVGLIWQQKTINALQRVRSDLPSPVGTAIQRLALRDAKAHGPSDREPLHISAFSPRGQGSDHNSSDPAAVPSGGDPEQLARLHRRYDPFLKQRGFTSEQINRWVTLMMEKENARLDLQAAMTEFGVPGGSKEVESLRAQLTDSYWKEMKAMLGADGFAAFGLYEEMSAYRSYLSPVAPMLSVADLPLSTKQSDQLTLIIAANDHPQRTQVTDSGPSSHIDWVAVKQQAGEFLTPAQQAIFSRYIHRTP
jgi:RNA polymerase sigma factor (sigma-70 family)